MIEHKSLRYPDLTVEKLTDHFRNMYVLKFNKQNCTEATITNALLKNLIKNTNPTKR
jgi:hypothetical protein